jgi:hypothetical protein
MNAASCSSGASNNPPAAQHGILILCAQPRPPRVGAYPQRYLSAAYHSPQRVFSGREAARSAALA